VQQQFLELHNEQQEQQQQQQQQQSDGTTLVVKASETSDDRKVGTLHKSTTRGRRLSYVTKDVRTPHYTLLQSKHHCCQPDASSPAATHWYQQFWRMAAIGF
jgi:hypothetical protein